MRFSAWIHLLTIFLAILLIVFHTTNLKKLIFLTGLIILLKLFDDNEWIRFNYIFCLSLIFCFAGYCSARYAKGTEGPQTEITGCRQAKDNTWENRRKLRVWRKSAGDSRTDDAARKYFRAHEIF
jgi:hypothetical protein